NISKIKSEFLILNFAIRHNLTDVALEDFIALINCHLSYTVYHTKHYKYNVHLLLHIPEFIEQFRTLWAIFTFLYEYYNGILKQMFRNSQAVPKNM
ncbi:hypothetical protein ALC53_06540, partial [Atta colombica]